MATGQDPNILSVGDSQIRSSSQAGSVKSLEPEPSEDESEYGAIKKLAFKSRMLGQIASASFNEKDQYEPLPIYDYSLFEEKQVPEALNINVNPFTVNKCYFMPNTPISVKVKAKRKSRHHIFYPYNYKIKLRHGANSWSVEHTFKEIKEVHKILAKTVKADLGKSCSDISRDQYKPEWPLFPSEHEYLIHESGANERSKKLETYFDKLLRFPPFRDHPAILTFVNGLGKSIAEGLIYKRFYDNLYTGSFQWMRKICNENFKVIADKRWFVLKDSYIAYLSEKFKDDSVGFVMLVDTGFKCTKKIKPGAYYGLQIKNQQRTLILRFKNSQKQNEWFDKITNMLNGPSKLFRGPLPNSSFAPIRSKQLCRWFINAQDYFENIYNAIDSAKEEIFITDWWMSPELYLKRPINDFKYRLDKVLHKKAQEGVKVYVLLFKELEFALGLMSSRTQSILEQEGKNPNVKVMRHPKNTTTSMSMWSHHEKCLVVDQSIAFMGGIDLCYGRWDDDMHRLTDLGREENVTEFEEPPEAVAEKKSNEGVEDTAAVVPECTLDSALKQMNILALNVTSAITSQPIPLDEKNLYKKLSMDGAVLGEDMSTTERFRQKYRRFKQRMHQYKDDVEDKLEEYGIEFDSSTESLTDQVDSGDQISLADTLYHHDLPVLSTEYYYWEGKDYSNCYKEDFKDLEEFSKDQFDRTSVQRMPWRDEAMCIFGESARDIARHFIQRWNHCKYDMEYENPLYPFLVPKTSSFTINVSAYKDWFTQDLYKCSTQILRSLDGWSGGLTQTEKSVLNGYIMLIEKAEYYIYIENQFFVTTTNPIKDEVKNMIGLAIVNRIKKAHSENKSFKVYVVLPLFPAFDNQNAIAAVQYYNLRSIKFGEFSIYNELIRAGLSDPSKYITFHGMRNWTVLMGQLTQEIIYVHSKLMIVDDTFVICGSANINDRSMLGSRDSELACLVKDEEFEFSEMNGRFVKVGKYASSLRKKIFKLHLGIYYENPNKISVMDCASDKFFDFFKKVSAQNTRIYEDCFKCLPSNEAKTFAAQSEYINQSKLVKSDPHKAKKLLEEHVSGFVVDFPLEFMADESNFYPSKATKEGLVPVIVWI